MNQTLFAISQYCSLHGIDLSFIQSLETEGLISLTQRTELPPEEDSSEPEGFIEEAQLERLELYTRWHHDLGINTAGIDAVQHLLDKLQQVQEEVRILRHRLRLYEPEE